MQSLRLIVTFGSFSNHSKSENESRAKETLRENCTRSYIQYCAEAELIKYLEPVLIRLSQLYNEEDMGAQEHLDDENQ